MINIILNKPDDFLKIKETLTRMGVANKKDKILYQSCHILQKQGQYFIAHFKDMMKLDGKTVNITDDDLLRTLSITKTLESWGLLRTDIGETEISNNFRVIKFSQKSELDLRSKYTVGN